MKALLLGDLCPIGPSTALFAAGDVAGLFTDTVGLFRGNDINFVNLECALTESENRIKKFGPNLKAPAQTAQVMKALGVTCCGLSNNHVFDFGIEGAEDTLAALDAAGIDWTGFGQNAPDSRRDYIVEKNGERVAIITVCEHEYSYALEDRMGSREYDEYLTLSDIRRAKASCSRVIVIYHGGKELCQYPSPRLRRAFHAMAESGADVILGQHSHCISCYEEHAGCHILYGQGNFHFSRLPDSKDPEMWDHCLAVHYDTLTGEIAFTPVVNEGAAVTLTKGEKKEEILAGFARRSASLRDGSWKEGWHAFCESRREHYEQAIRECGDRFGHYLDCEAHTDVWRELFPTYNQTNER